MASLATKLTSSAGAVALVVAALAVVGPASPAFAATCNVTGWRSDTTASYERKGGDCYAIRASVSRLNSSTGVVTAYKGAWKSSGISTVTASNGYAYGGGYDIWW